LSHEKRDLAYASWERLIKRTDLNELDANISCGAPHYLARAFQIFRLDNQREPVGDACMAFELQQRACARDVADDAIHGAPIE
jgi:hypothetical protein